MYRKDPIPGTGYRRFGYGWRAVRTINEKRQTAGHDSKYVRAKRNTNLLPDSWDDVWRAWYVSWKQCRKIKRQWMKHVK